MDAIDVLKQSFGYNTFREGQGELIHSVLQGRDVLGVMPTGAGKSLCYQIPALMFPGITLVISPLIALMRDQVMALKAGGISAAYINSSLSDAQCAMAVSNAKKGKYKLIYVAPERLLSSGVASISQSGNINYVAVDEAHCVSQWGHDFRPSYLNISAFIDTLPKRPVLAAYTATATTRVREDIIELLKLKEPDQVITSFDRPNLFFQVRTPSDKYGELAQYLQNNDVNGIVYCSTRKQVERVTHQLQADGISAVRYHAGLDDKERSNSQDDFLYDRARIIVATNAFGMGIDKSNVRFVIHYNMPKNIENYYQEAGRAGRDGLPADCILFYARNDLFTALRLINTSNNQEEIFRNKQLLDHMERYCESEACLRGFILKYFGEKASDDCGNCGNCHGDIKKLDVTLDAQKILSSITRLNRAGKYLNFTHTANILLGRSEDFKELQSFGLMKGQTRKYIRTIVNRLKTLGYLAGDKNMIVTQKARDVLFGDAKVMIREETTKSKKIMKQMDSKDARYDFSEELFQKLKKMRLEIAKEEKVAAFIIFSDATLVDMCQKRPKKMSEMLDVIGIGKIKLERYGQRFLNLLLAEAQGKVADEEKMDTVPLDLSNMVELSENLLPISQVADTINAVLIRYGKTNTSGKKLNDLLEEAGYLKLQEGNRIPSQKGRDIGIMTIERESEKGSYTQCLFSKHAKEICIELFSQQG